MNAPSGTRGTSRVHTLALFASSILAVANLPAHELPIAWLLAFTVPAALFGALPWPRHRPTRGAAAVLLQTGAIVLATTYAPAMSRPAALACTVLPPLAFATARRREPDPALALFLAFCILVVGVILDGVAPTLVVAWSVAACVVLRSAAVLATRGAARASVRDTANLPSARSTLWSALAIAIPCLLAALAIDRLLALLPSPSRAEVVQPPPLPASAERRPGLDDTFVIDGSTPREGDAERIVRVRSVDGTAVPRDLYLRSGFFAVPALDRWRTGHVDPIVKRRLDSLALRAPAPNVPLSLLTIERFAGTQEFVFAPPGTVEIRDLPWLRVDLAREWIREPGRGSADPYTVAWQPLPAPPPNTPSDPDAPAAELLALPHDFDRTPYDALLDEWRVGTDPITAAETIAAGLAHRCTYDRTEPTGPYRHAIENFLFAPKDRHGYCVHFASATALLLRLRGIPCRLGVGLHGGDLDLTDRRGRLYFTRHAHAWVEIPFANRGFVVVDPTPPGERGGASFDLTGDEAEGETTPPPGNPMWELLRGMLQTPWVPAIVLAIVVALVQVPRRRRRQKVLTSATAETSAARRHLVRLLQALAQAGHRRPSGTTLELFARSLAAEQRLPAAVDGAFLAYQQVRFGGRPFDDARQSSMDAGIEAAAAMSRET